MVNKINSTEMGSVIVTILAMLVLISLGVGMVMMFSTSSLQVAENNIQLRATILGDAGFRYAAGEYLSAGDLAAKFSRLESLHDEEVTLLDNDGSFKLSVQSYWFVTDSDHNMNDTTLSLRVLGKFPDDFEASIPATGQIKINFEFYTFSSVTTTLGSGFNSDQLSVSITPGLKEAINVNTSVQLAFAPPGFQTITTGGNITISSSNELTDLFPERNGLIQIFKDVDTDSGTYKYKERQNGSIILSGISAVKDGELPLSITPTSQVVIKKQAKIVSTGSFGSGTVGSSRGLSLNVFLTDEELIPADSPEELDLGGIGPGRSEIFDDEEDGHTKLTNWEFDDDDLIPEADKLTVTTQMIDTEFGTSSNYVTFQNFDRPEPSSGYTVKQVDADDVPTSENLNGIWGNAADNIYAVGDRGTILHYDGSVWSSKNSGTGKTLRAIWGTEDKDNGKEITKILVVGDEGTIRIKEGDGSWKKDPTARNIPTSYDLYTAWGSDWDFVQGSGNKGVIPYKWVKDYGNKWRKFPNGGDKFPADDRLNDERSHFRSIWNEKINNKQILLYCGVRTPSNNDPNTGFIFKELPGNWNKVKALYYDDKEFRGVWGASEKNIYVVGNKGTQGVMLKLKPHITLSKANLKKDMWSTINLPAGTKKLNGIYGANENYIYAVGEEGTILFYNGVDWVKIPNDATTGTLTLNSVWGNKSIGLWGVGNNGAIVFLGYPENKIGGHMLPLSQNNAIKAKWAATNRYLSYSIQTKVVWGDTLNYAASGIQFRWHQVSTGKYAGYGVSFMRYDPSNDASNLDGSNYNDMIPNEIKPTFNWTGDAEKNNRLLIVLWEQYVQGGGEHRRWLAYKDISSDSKMVRADGSPIDHASIIVRVHEKLIEGVKVNDINIYYGNASTNNQGYDQKYNNTIRNKYNATFGTDSDIIKWPVFDLDDWTNCPNFAGSNTICETADSFTLVDNVTVHDNPERAGTVTIPNLWIINPLSDLAILKNNFTIRTSRFTTPTGTAFGSQSDRSEIGIHVYGDLGDSASNTRVNFTDFTVQLGVDADAVHSESSFSCLQ